MATALRANKVDNRKHPMVKGMEQIKMSHLTLSLEVAKSGNRCCSLYLPPCILDIGVEQKGIGCTCILMNKSLIIKSNKYRLVFLNRDCLSQQFLHPSPFIHDAKLNLHR